MVLLTEGKELKAVNAREGSSERRRVKVVEVLGGDDVWRWEVLYRWC